MMIVDTNVISEAMRPQPLASVLKWLNTQDGNWLFVTTVTLAEIGYGLRILPEGQRRWQLQSRFEQFIAQAFEERVLDFTASAARAYAEIMGHRKEVGHPMSLPDGQIASIAHAHGFAIATRNIKDFEDCGLELINPFE
ncbi:MAG: VapC toxin family PIN domain ribonuclease [Betaproteobacteria bacterium CG2_30_59_46]|nr:MAG: VapC toxin family PIN domain ribonuclease [Betaproteobacteria bacterium CG2_30_59_46]PIQ13788.1 MAG: VapC toxin family PIN domain ribonuclease [Hydrogenophilales bacterium CG18_big_fil_WC_8_21_14_2_50_58_12]PIX99301.1 MAG: VapC toxin family PIN domain ribonuclease [Hydrogenophilales bacterium CG_4_10_14_3_um_filter_58_23]PJB08800.1 MAG: VapC toxin family PIN domain ribonuclease [Hydrogenophilales bacterium CG_4_9_14_3_um_filter_59_35]